MVKKRDQITANAKGGLRFRIRAAIADLPELREQTVTTALAWLAEFALDFLYRGRRVTIPGFIYMKLKDKRFDWGRVDGDPSAADEMFAKKADIDVETFRLIASGEATPTEEDLSGIASAVEEDVDLLIEIAQGRGPFINGGAGVHAERH